MSLDHESFLTNLPTGWKFDRFKDLAILRNERTDEASEVEDYLELEDIEPGTGRILNRRNTMEVVSDVTVFQKGDVLFGKLRPYLEKYYVAEFDGKCTGEILAFKPKRIESRFLFYCIASSWFIQRCNMLAYGTKMPRVNWPTQLAQFNLPLPPLSDQQHIAAYLDASCAAIDAAVAAKRRQIETLDALRKTIIHNVITRGVNAEFDESIVGRIEKIPHSWKKVKLFRICQKISSGGTPSTFNLDYYGGNIPWVQTGDLNDGYVEMTEKTITELGLQESAARIYPEGTLLMAMYGATIGKLGILKNPSATNQACCAMKLRNDVDNRFIFYLLRDFRPTLISMSYGGGQPNISQETIKQLYFFLPPFHEQRKISQHLDIKTSTIESIKAGIESQISTLTAYRKSLIHECVTGQRRVTEADVARARREKEMK